MSRECPYKKETKEPRKTAKVKGTTSEEDETGMPDVPDDALEMMAGFSSEPNPELLPWNRCTRRHRKKSRGWHGDSPADAGRWKGALPDDMDSIRIL